MQAELLGHAEEGRCYRLGKIGGRRCWGVKGMLDGEASPGAEFEKLKATLIPHLGSEAEHNLYRLLVRLELIDKRAQVNMKPNKVQIWC